MLKGKEQQENVSRKIMKAVHFAGEATTMMAPVVHYPVVLLLHIHKGPFKFNYTCIY